MLPKVKRPLIAKRIKVVSPLPETGGLGVGVDVGVRVSVDEGSGVLVGTRGVGEQATVTPGVVVASQTGPKV